MDYIFNMNIKEATTYASWCNSQGITIFPVPTSNVGIYKIAINTRGKVEQGQQYYRNEPLQGQVSIWDKIRQLYKEIFDKNNK